MDNVPFTIHLPIGEKPYPVVSNLIASRIILEEIENPGMLHHSVPSPSALDLLSRVTRCDHTEFHLPPSIYPSGE